MNKTLPPICGDGFLAALSRPRVAASFWQVPEREKFAQMCKNGLEIAEVRLDLARSPDEESGRAILSAVSALPSVLTIRPQWEGGEFGGDENARCELFRRLSPFASALDIELAAEIRPKIIAAAKQSGAAVVASKHNFSGIDSVEEMCAAAETAFAASADVFKYAAAVKDENEYAALKSFLQEWHTKPVVVIGMGDSEFARRTRLEFPALGSRIAFAAGENASAPGQLTLAETAAAVREFSP